MDLRRTPLERNLLPRLPGFVGAAVMVLAAGRATLAAPANDPPLPSDVRTTLTRYCYACHAGGSHEGELALDTLLGRLGIADPQANADAQAIDHPRWLAVWKNLRAQTMPPADEEQPGEVDRTAVLRWIEQRVFQLDPASPDPGRVTLRRLNRIEYQFTIRDLLGIDFDAIENFPADDSGYGFDTIGDVLTISPLLMEKYIEAAEAIVARAVPVDGPQPPKHSISPYSFKVGDKKVSVAKLPFDDSVRARQTWKVVQSGRYRVRVEMRASGSDEATANTARVGVLVDDQLLKAQELGWESNNTIVMTAETKVKAGDRALAIDLTPLEPPLEDENRLYLNVRKIEVQGPLDGDVLEYPPEFRTVFFDGPPSDDRSERRAYARKILRHFADRAFRRPIDEPSLDRLVALAMDVEPDSKEAFEQRIARSLTAVLVSPRFLFRAEVQPEPDSSGRIVPLDEFALAARMSYFLWSSLPDDELFNLAREHKLRKNLAAQVDRMLDDPRSQRFVDNFIGQWLLTRDVDTIHVEARRILRLKSGDEANRIFSRSVRDAMRDETEMLFAYLLRENRSIMELFTANYTFLNEPLARFYGIKGVKGNEMRKVELSKGDHRGGILTHGSVLLVTSNPTLTSPVKRGLFVLENLLGTPSAPPPPDVPPLDEDATGTNRKRTLRELMEVHREKPLCASCHARMDPIGLTLEEYNGIGQWRDNDLGKRIDTAGQLITGEKFGNTRELERVIATDRRVDFFRCLVEKMLTFAVGRGVEYYDAPTIDALVAAMQSDDGRIRTLVQGIVTSAPFQKRRGDGERAAAQLQASTEQQPNTGNRP